MLGREDPKLSIVPEKASHMSRNPYEFTEEFREPQTIAEAQDRLFELRQDLNKIRQQLNDPERKDRMNLSDDEYTRWRHKATHARNAKSVQQQKLNHWLSTHRARRAIDAVASHEPVAIMGELVEMINEFRQRHHIPLTNSQQNLLSLADNIVNNDPVGR